MRLLTARSALLAIVASTAPAVAVLASADALAALPPPPPASPVSIDQLSAQSPAAAALATAAEGQLAAGQPARALELYAQASQTAPRSGFPARRECELATFLGHRQRSIAACNRALAYGATVPDLRAAVAAAMSNVADPRVPPSVDEVIDAYQLAVGAQRQLPGKPHAYAAFADVARRVGDPELLRTSVAEIERLAPGEYESLRARALAPARLGWLRLAGWTSLLVLAVLGVRRWSRRRAPGRPAVPASRRPAVDPAAHQVALCLLLAGAAAVGLDRRAEAAPPEPPASSAPPQQLSEIPIDERDPSLSLPTPEEANRHPLQFGYLLMDLATRAEIAEKRGRFDQAVKYYRALARAVPEKSISFGKMCAAYEAQGLRDEALEACRNALGREGVRVDDHLRYVRLLLAHPGPLLARERDEVTDIAAHLRKDPATAAAAHDVQCQLGARIRDVALLEGCVQALTAQAPDDVRTISYGWALAMEKRDYSRAAGLVDRARGAGLDAVGLDRMEQAVRAAQRRRQLPLWGAAGAVLLIGLVLLARKRLGGLPWRRAQPGSA